MPGLDRLALVVVDLQKGFDDLDHWSPTGCRDNPACEANISALLVAWREARRPVVFVRHDSTEDGSPLQPGTPGNAFKPELTGDPDLLVVKETNSAFFGRPDLEAWLRDRAADLDGVVLCGVSTNHCVETTARVAGNLGFETLLALDACHTFDRRAPDGAIVRAEELARATAASLHGEFATVTSTAELLGPQLAQRLVSDPPTPTPTPTPIPTPTPTPTPIPTLTPTPTPEAVSDTSAARTAEHVLRVPSASPYAQRIGFSAAARADGWILLAGTTAIDAEGEVVGDDAYAQAREALRKVEDALAAAGAGLEDVVQTRMYLVDATDQEGVGRAHGELFAGVGPVATMVVVAALIDPRMRVEIEATAWVGP